MQTLVKSISIISAIFVGIGLCLACSIELKHASFLMYVQVYGPIILVLILGAIGLNVASNPNRYFSVIFAAAHAIVSTIYAIRNYLYQNFSTTDKLHIFYYEGLEIYDRYYYI